MTSTLKTVLQESLQQEDVALKARLDTPIPAAETPPARPARAPRPRKAAAPPKAEKPVAPAKKPRAAAPKASRSRKSVAPPEVSTAPPAAAAPKPQKVTRESFSLPEGEATLLRALRTAIAKEGRISTKSEVIRAGIQLAASLPTPELMARLDTLAPVVKKMKKK